VKVVSDLDCASAEEASEHSAAANHNAGKATHLHEGAKE